MNRSGNPDSTSGRPRRGHRAARLLPLLVWAIACAPPDARQEHDAIASWTATVRMTAHQWSAGAIPGRFVDRMLESVQRKLAQEEKQIARVDAPPDTLAALRRELDEAAVLTDRTRAAVGAGDRTTATADPDPGRALRGGAGPRRRSRGGSAG